jgi:hypothetical protein
MEQEESIMNTNLEIVVAKDMNSASIEAALMQNNYSKLPTDEKVLIYNRTCETLGLNPLTQPFGFYKQKDGSECLYAKRNCADQLRQIHGVTLVECKFEEVGGIYSAIVTMEDKAGRRDMDRGDVYVEHLKGMDLANAKMKALTKAKRRCTLSLCGLGYLDESEVADSPNLKAIAGPIQQVQQVQQQVASSPIPVASPVPVSVPASQDQKREIAKLFVEISASIPNLTALMAEEFPGVTSGGMNSAQAIGIKLWLMEMKEGDKNGNS